MIIQIPLSKVLFRCRGNVFLISLTLIVFFPALGFSQSQDNWQLERWPQSLERDFALSSLPPHLRDSATVYLLDPNKGYYISKKGSNGFVCFVLRMEWEWGVYNSDVATAISYDAEGAKTIFPVYLDMAAMRATGKFKAAQIKDTIIARIKAGIYKAPARTGISYMLAPVMRTYANDPGDYMIMTMAAPHRMFYAPYLTDTDIGGKYPGPFIGNPGDKVLGKGKGPFGYVIVLTGQAERVKILEENKDLIKRLGEYKPYLKADAHQ